MLEEIQLVTPKIFSDDRGFFLESYNQNTYRELGISVPFVQDNVAFSKRGTIRGLHFQRKPGQAKLLSCEQGKIWDVAVDIRRDSASFGKWIAFELDDERREQLFIPVGFAHGYCVLSETALVRYKVSSFYDPKEECAIRWNDPDLKIEWPELDPLLSFKDLNSPFFRELFP